MTRSWRITQQGFTLVEILVVAAIMAVILGMTVVRLESSDASRVKDVAEKMSQALERARDSAIISGRSVAFSSDGSGYQFWSADTGLDEWKSLNDTEELGARVFRDGVHLINLQVNGRSRPLGERLVFSPDGVADTFELTVQSGPALMVLSADVMGRIELRNAPQ